ncbi:MAG: iron-sulfur cluster assembly accessory protein [Gammaproteobacteria bacterium]|nr:iron-sulfur cluster assembly accessory protein [Gammaproteobacteria bacterium]MDH3467975.1 iron-sulfur cluster assembly accessory protein [Gammaproteobacteria bacterium]
MITISKLAAEQILQSSIETAAAGMVLRIAAKRNADGSIEYAMGFDNVDSNDTQITCEDVRIAVAPTSVELLSDVTLDYVELEPGQFHFIFQNPNDPHYVPPRNPRKGV